MEKYIIKALIQIAVLLQVFIMPGTLFSQYHKNRFEHLTSDDGLSYNTVEGIVQDSKGFMWFATKDGLNKFDGYKFTVYRHNVEDTNSIADNIIYCLLEDDNKNIWLGGDNGGLILFNKQNETFENFKHNPSDQTSISDNLVQSIYQDTKGNIWVGTAKGGLNRFDKEKRKFKRYIHAPYDLSSISSNNVQVITEDNNGNLWIGTTNGINKFNEKENKFEHFFADPKNPKSLSNDTLISMITDRHGKIWCGTVNGLNRFDPITKEFKQYFNSSSHYEQSSALCINTILEDRAGKVWLGTANGGLFQYSYEQDTLVNCKYVPSNRNNLSQNSILTLYEDRSGIIWIGTVGNGLSKFIPQKNDFMHFNHDPFNEYSLGNNLIRCFHEDNLNRLWVGTVGGGVSVLSKVTGEFEHFKTNPKSPNCISHNDITQILQDSYGTMWIGTWGGGLNKFENISTHPEISYNGKFTHYKHNSNDESSISNNIIQLLFEDSHKNLWIGTESGLNLYDRKSDKFIHFRHEPDKPGSIANNQIQSCMIEDSKGNIWFGSWKGLIRMLPSKIFLHYQHKQEKKNSLSDNRVISLCLAKNGIIWIGTCGGGLNKMQIEYNKDQAKEIIKFTRYGQKEGLINNVIYGIQEDNNGCLWLSTNSGLVRFNPEIEEFKTYKAADGIQNNQFSWGASLKGKNGEMYFGGVNGFNIFIPDSIKENSTIPEVVITDFQIFSKSVLIGDNSPLQKHISEVKEITLSHKQSVFSFEFAALEYTAPEKNHYAYMLEGFDEDWHYIGTNRIATYTNLEHGEYIFRVKASNNDGVWNDKGVTLSIIILPPWWLTWWFRILTLTFIVSTFFTLYKIRINALKKQKKVLEEKVDIRTRELLETNTILEESKKKIEIKNDELEASEEEYKQLNEELTATNELLNIKNNELEHAFGKLKETQSQLVQAERMASLGILTAGISHEINNPLNFIQGAKVALEEQLKQKYNDYDSDIKSLMEIIEKGVNRTAAIVCSLNRFNRKNGNKAEKCKIGLIIDDCLVMLQNKLKHKIEIKQYFTDSEYILNGNEGDLHQVFVNILTNAIEAIPNKGVITISTRIENKNLLTEISDTGKGICQDNIKKITNPFYTTKEPGEGTGLGMSIAYSIIKNHNGSIRYQSEPGKGTTAYVSFPIKQL